MVEIPVIVTPPDCHPFTNIPDNGDQPGILPGDPDFSPVAHEVKFTSPPMTAAPVPVVAMVSEGTQTESPNHTPGPEASPVRTFSPCNPLSPTRSHSDSKPHFPPFPPWRELRHRIYGPHPVHPGSAVVNEGKVEGYLSPPEEPPKCPMTPQADLYDGQSPSTFGMQFDRPSKTYWRRNSKPATCAQNYEDHKHRMLMEWLERRNSV
ncbi:hypothetical protein AYL99_05672 [Fonsecaea erecta]|uniref:Uncharacterized protein n=1 Tax=Fonsecaea erecta TaxID=1367422 RepID=A0A178ZLK1_9EURO|nr:hypothetical protein AYL99_05672 [Fonsecaea erecta]OAP60670.1 hypothetical protein AYL99_05672 [Fonsecaea erecta]